VIATWIYNRMAPADEDSNIHIATPGPASGGSAKRRGGPRARGGLSASRVAAYAPPDPPRTRTRRRRRKR
jgi:hypothetical protein